MSTLTIPAPTRIALADRRLDISQTFEVAGDVAAGPDPGTIRGTAARYGQPVDRGYGMSIELVAGCFDAAVRDPARIPVLWQHDRVEPIGRINGLTDSSEKLDYAGWISGSEDVPNGRKALSLLKDKVISEVSVGFRIQKFERIEDREADTVLFRILRAWLMELSTVTFGAFGQGATVEEVFATQAPSPPRPNHGSLARARMAGWL